MIRKVSIENLRGIEHGELDGLAPLTILTGPNGCGKSTVLDALLIAASSAPGEAVGKAVQRHPVSRDGARWLVRNATAQVAAIELVRSDERERMVALKSKKISVSKPRLRTGDLRPDSTVEIQVVVSPQEAEALAKRYKNVDDLRVIWQATNFDKNNDFEVEPSDVKFESLVGDVGVVDPGLPEALAEDYSDAVRAGSKAEIASYLEHIASDARSLEILSDDGVPSLYINYEGRAPVPVSMVGDGVQAFLQLAIQLAQVRNGLALVEEPEVYQHPRALYQTAKALVTAMRRGVQVVMTTHSLELIDAILATVEEDELDKLAFFSLVLDGGKLKSSRYSGTDGAFARDSIGRDLR